MKRLLLAGVLAFCPVVVQAQSDEVKMLIQRVQVLTEMCQGESGNDPNTWKACDLRNQVGNQLQKLGWCWGHDGQIEADKSWEPCQTVSNQGIQSDKTLSNHIVPDKQWFVINQDNTIEMSYSDRFYNVGIAASPKENQLMFAVGAYIKSNIAIVKIGKSYLELEKSHDIDDRYFYYVGRIPNEKTKDFVHAFTAESKGVFVIDGQVTEFPLQGTTAVMGDFIKRIEEAHISLPPPFKDFNSDKPTIQQAAHELEDYVCGGNIDLNKVTTIVSSCYANYDQGNNKSLPVCILEDFYAMSVIDEQKKKGLSEDRLLELSNGFFSGDNRLKRAQKYHLRNFNNFSEFVDYFGNDIQSLNNLMAQKLQSSCASTTTGH